MMEVATRENRSPLAAALSRCPEREIPLWKEDVASLAIELTKRFHGSQNEGFLRQGLKDAVNLCGIGLLLECGQADAQTWADCLRRQGIRGLSLSVSRMAKEIAKAPEKSPFWREHAGEVPAEIIRGALQVAARTDPAEALKGLTARLGARNREQKEHALGKTLLGTATGRAVLELLESQNFGHAPTCDEFFMQTIPHLLGIPAKRIPKRGNLPKGEEEEEGGGEEVGAEPAMTILLGPKQWATAKRKFAEFLERISPELQGALLGLGNPKDPKSWFEIHIAKETKEKRG